MLLKEVVHIFLINFRIHFEVHGEFSCITIMIQTLKYCARFIGTDRAIGKVSQGTDSITGVAHPEPRKGMVLPFQALSLAFNHINYYVEMPAVSHSY